MNIIHIPCMCNQCNQFGNQHLSKSGFAMYHTLNLACFGGSIIVTRRWDVPESENYQSSCEQNQISVGNNGFKDPNQRSFDPLR